MNLSRECIFFHLIFVAHIIIFLFRKTLLFVIVTNGKYCYYNVIMKKNSLAATRWSLPHNAISAQQTRFAAPCIAFYRRAHAHCASYYAYRKKKRALHFISVKFADVLQKVECAFKKLNSDEEKKNARCTERKARR